MPKVSVVMASYNHEKFVGKTVESVLSQTYQDFELIITDDGSSDRTVNVIKEYDDPRIKLFCFPQNRGVCTAMNNSINEAKGEYIAVINSDDIWLPHKLQKQVSFLDANLDIGAVFSYASFINDNNEDIGYEHIYGRIFIQHNRSRFQWLKDFFVLGNCLCHPSVLIRKICYENVGLYDERFAQLADFDMWVRLVTKYQIHILTENLVKFRLLNNQQNMSSNKPENNSRVTLELSQVLKNYLNPEILNNLNEIFGLKTNIDEVGVSFKLQPVSRDIAPFFLAMLASRDARQSHKYFCFDVLYQMLANQELAQKLREHYFFDFNSLVNLALSQDIFGIVRVGEMEARLQRKNAEIKQLQEDKQDSLDSLRNQLRDSELILEEYQSQLQKTEDEYRCFVDDLRSQLYQSEELLSEYKTHIQELEAITNNYQAQYLESQTQMQQAKTDAKEYQDKYRQSEDALHKHKTELEQLKEQFHTRMSEAEALIDDYHQQLKQTESVLTDYQGSYEETQLELQKVRSQLHQNQTELKRYEFEYYQLIQELSILDQQTKQNEAITTEKQEIIMQLEAARDNIQQEAEQLEILLQEYQSHIDELQQAIEDLLSSKQDDANTYKQELKKLHQNQVEAEIALGNYQSQLKATQVEIAQLKSWQTFNDSQVSEGGASKYKTLVWQGWQAYKSGNYGQMANYLQQSLGHASLSRGQAMIDWVENFGRFASAEGTELDTYSLTNLPEWQQLVRQVVRSSPAKLSILAGGNGIIPK